MAELRIGISGWRYAPWRGTFYPPKLAQRRELEYAANQLNSIEINGSFYSLQRPSSYREWYAQTPADFVFAVKGGRFITHMKRLRDVETPLANFFASGVLALREKLGPILWQFPPSFAFDVERFETFFRMLPRDTAAAAALAKRHNAKVRGRALTKTDKKRRVRHAIEIRHDSFKTPRFIQLLRKYNIALVFADTAGRWPYMEDITADFIYCRLHGDEELYVSGYTDAALKTWADRIRTWQAGKEKPDGHRVSDRRAKKRARRDVYVYFDNDVKVRAPFDAMNLMRRLNPDDGAEPIPPPDLTHSRAAASATARPRWPTFRRTARKKR